MDLKKYKASVQLAEMRYNAAPTEDNKQLLDNAREALELAENPEKKTEDSQVAAPEASGATVELSQNQDAAPVDPEKPAPLPEAPALEATDKQNQDSAPVDLEKAAPLPEAAAQEATTKEKVAKKASRKATK